ncbi:DNRLRE domain-containing protein [Lentzea terrae]|uniref:DNRLRE domain-containing protein n=1 Tax=Lentzea terrae TaxID=2200761 RepID=UPI000DD3FB56|nr:DNRLRE domain-containing protein [Lentzea terrae]
MFALVLVTGSLSAVAPVAKAAPGPSTLLTPQLVRSNGAQLRWTRAEGEGFTNYQVHRSAAAGFTPSATTLVTTIGDRDTIQWADTTAAPNKTFRYRVVTGTAVSNEIAVTTTAPGQSKLVVNAAEGSGAATYVTKDTTSPQGCYDWNNYGGAQQVRVGAATDGVVHRGLVRFDVRDIPIGATITNATMTLSYSGTTATVRPMNVHRVTRAWNEGRAAYPGSCDGSGASWLETQGGVRWSNDGTDNDPAALATIAAKSRTTAGKDAVNLAAEVGRWVRGDVPNHGLLIKAADETVPASGAAWLDYASDDAAERPTLEVTFADGTPARAPLVVVTSPEPDSATDMGEHTLRAQAGDDAKVTKVDFLVDGKVVGTDNTAPYEAKAQLAEGVRTVTATATDDAGNTSTSPPSKVTARKPYNVMLDTYEPRDNTTVRGQVAVHGLDWGGGERAPVDVMQILVDGTVVASTNNCGQVPDGGECQGTWNSLDPMHTWEDGPHEITTRLVAQDGRLGVLSPLKKVVLDNDTLDLHRAKVTLNDPATADDDAPPIMAQNTTAGVPQQDPYGAPPDENGIGGGSLGRSVRSSPGAMLPPSQPHRASECPSAAHCATVSVTNESKQKWDGSEVSVWYRWLADNGAVLLEQPADVSLPAEVAPGQTVQLPITVHPPKLPPGADTGKFEFRVDLFDTAADSWFSAMGNEALVHPVTIAKDARDMLGLERFWHYESEDLGAGMTSLTNVANGNVLLRWSPFFAPGRGLATTVDLTYNSLEDHSKSPAGHNFSLAVSGLVRLGERLEVEGLLFARGVELVDGDGTRHRFDRKTDSNGKAYWAEPPGVNLYLREIRTNPADRRWAVTRPDAVTYWFNDDGYPTAVTDRNGNTIVFELEDTPLLDDPGGPRKRIKRVVDPGGRGFVIDYWTKDEIRKPHVRGKVQRITDHSGSALDFTYYEDGNLLRLTQAGGTSSTGQPVPSRSFVFTYTTYSGDDPAIADPKERIDPDPRTRGQSTRIFSVRDPRGAETSFDYYSPREDAAKRWRLQTRANRNGHLTSFDYDLANKTSSVFAPESRVSKYTYDADGKATKITNALNQTTTVEWTGDFKVAKVTEPTNRSTSYTYNANGYLTSQTDQLNQRSELSYVDSAVDGQDAGRHLSLLETVTKPKGVATTTAGDFQWKYSYDATGNVDKVTDPTGAVTDYDYNGPGTAAPGTVSAMRDANGNAPTTYPEYDPSGQPARVVDPLGRVTRFGYDVDGQLRWIQDPNHAGDSGADERSYRTFFDYDPFHRLDRQSAPKSTGTDRGELMWSSVAFDANDNPVRRVDPHFGRAESLGTEGPVASGFYDNMDRPLVVGNPDRSVDPEGERVAFEYDAAGRVVKQTMPLGVQSATVADDHTTTYAYDKLDRPTRETRFGATTAEARFTHMCYDLAGDLVSVTSPRAKATSVACPATGNKFTTFYTYDAAHQLLSETDPVGMAQRYRYDGNGNLTSHERDIVAGRSTRTEFEFDQRDQRVLLRERFDGAAGRNVETRISYDRNGNRKQLITPRGVDDGRDGTFDRYVTSYDYDAVNRLVKVSLPFDGADNTERQYVHRDYDPNGNMLWTSAPVTTANRQDVRDSAKTLISYFDPGWIRTSKDPGGTTVRMDYFAQGWQKTRTPDQQGAPGQPDNNKRVDWTYFNDGKLSTRKEFLGQPSTYTYDANGNLTRAVDARGSESPEQQQPTETETRFTGFDEVAKTRHHKRGEPTWKFTAYTYDENGNTKVRAENGEENDAGTQTKAPVRHELFYGENDWLSSQLDLGTDGACKGDQRIVNTFWGDGWERQREIFRAGDGCSADPATWTKQQTTTWDYFDNGKLRNLVTRTGSGEITESHDVGYIDDAGNYANGHRVTDRFLLKRAEGKNATQCVGPQTCLAKYTYDARDKLVRHQKREGKVDTFKLDEPDKLDGDNTIRSGNVTTENNAKGENITRRYEGSQLRKVSIGGASVESWYDNYGNLDCLTLEAGDRNDCSRSGGAPASPNVVTDHAYDSFDRLLNTRQYAGGGTPTDTTDYTYDALDRTTKEKEDHAGGGKDRTTDFTYQGLTRQITEEKQSGGDKPKTKSFSYDNYGNRIAMSDKDNGTGAEDKYSYSYDVQGSVSQLIGDAGKVKASYGYNAYGGEDAPESDQESLTTGDTDKQAPINPFRYTGKRMDSGSAASGTSPVPMGSASYDMGARRYGPDLGQFLQRDQYQHALSDLGLAVDPLTQNRYALAGGNPISFVETDGHWPDLGAIGNAIKEGVNKAVDAAKNAVSKASSAVKDAGKAVGEAASKAGQAVGKAAQSAGNAVKDAARATADKAGEVGEDLKQFAGAAKRAVQSEGSQQGFDIAERTHKAVEAIEGGVTSAGQVISRTMQNAGDKAGKAINRGANAISQLADSPVGKATGRALTAVGGLISFGKHYSKGDSALEAGAKAGIETLGGIVGGIAGGFLGSFFGPGGTAVGIFIGSQLGQLGAEKAVEKFEKPIEEVTNKGKKGWLGDALSGD